VTALTVELSRVKNSQVFDVTKGRKHYGPGGGYSFFSGRDGSRAFVSGDFTEEGVCYSHALFERCIR